MPTPCARWPTTRSHRHYPELADAAQPYLAFFEAIAERQAALIAQWQLVGFIHGVMNTDNMAISGETIDYGPCAFMDAYDPDTVFSSIDRAAATPTATSRAIAQWNLARLAEALLPLFDADRRAAVELATRVARRFAERVRAPLAGRHAREAGPVHRRDRTTQRSLDGAARAGCTTRGPTSPTRSACSRRRAAAAADAEADRRVRRLAPRTGRRDWHVNRRLRATWPR